MLSAIVLSGYVCICKIEVVAVRQEFVFLENSRRSIASASVKY
jgi:hypothetical protein